MHTHIRGPKMKVKVGAEFTQQSKGSSMAMVNAHSEPKLQSNVKSRKSGNTTIGCWK